MNHAQRRVLNYTDCDTSINNISLTLKEDINAQIYMSLKLFTTVTVIIL
jgi:hypothetical protein